MYQTCKKKYFINILNNYTFKKFKIAIEHNYIYTYINTNPNSFYNKQIGNSNLYYLNIINKKYNHIITTEVFLNLNIIKEYIKYFKKNNEPFVYKNNITIFNDIITYIIHSNNLYPNLLIKVIKLLKVNGFTIDIKYIPLELSRWYKTREFNLTEQEETRMLKKLLNYVGKLMIRHFYSYNYDIDIYHFKFSCMYYYLDYQSEFKIIMYFLKNILDELNTGTCIDIDIDTDTDIKTKIKKELKILKELKNLNN